MSTSDPSAADQQRARAARGIGSKQNKSLGSDRPAPPRRRRPALAALAVLLIVGGAALAGLLAMRLDSREPVLVLGQDVPVGTEITADMLSTTTVASDGLQLVPEDEASAVIGTYSLVPLKEGQLLETSTLTQNQPAGSDQVEIGLPVEPGRAPGELRSGDFVRLVRIGDGNSAPTPIATGLIKQSTTVTGDGGLGSGDSQSNDVTIILPATASDAAVDAAANQRLGLALIQRGVSIEDANITALGGR